MTERLPECWKRLRYRSEDEYRAAVEAKAREIWDAREEKMWGDDPKWRELPATVGARNRAGEGQVPGSSAAGVRTVTGHYQRWVARRQPRSKEPTVYRCPHCDFSGNLDKVWRHIDRHPPEAWRYAQVDRNPKGHDPAEGHGRNDESPVAATSGDAPEGS